MTDKHPDSVLIETGARIRRARIDAGLNLHDLARLTGISVGALSTIETGKRDLRLTTLSRVADALRLHLAALLGDPADDPAGGQTRGASEGEPGEPDAASGGYDLGDYE